MLGERRAAILRLIIEYYIKTGEPIGSKTLCNLCLTLCPAPPFATKWRT